MKTNFYKKTIICFSLFLSCYVAKAQTNIAHEVASTDSTKLNATNQVLADNEDIAMTDLVSENLDIVKMVSFKEITDEGTNDPTSSGMTLMYVDGKPIYTKVQKTGATTLSIIYIPKQN